MSAPTEGASLESQIGETAGPFRESFSLARVEAFAQVAGAKVRPGGPVPPTLLTVCREGEFVLLNRLGIALASVLHGSQEYRYERPILTGMNVQYETSLAEVTHKRNLTFLVLRTRVYSADEPGLALASARSTIVLRDQREK